jgi:hypothetical protein
LQLKGAEMVRDAIRNTTSFKIDIPASETEKTVLLSTGEGLASIKISVMHTPDFTVEQYKRLTDQDFHRFALNYLRSTRISFLAPSRKKLSTEFLHSSQPL